MKKVKIGIIGFGTVGAGVAENLLKNHEVIAKRTGVELELARIADLDITTDRGVRVPDSILTTDAEALIRDVDVVVELIGGTTAAKSLMLKAIQAGKPVVTANKALLALHGEEIFAAAEAAGVDVYYEASVAGGIPIIKALREGLAGNRINRMYGIMNGTCNYILTRMENEQVDFDVVLADAQKLGYAEAEPSLDIDGFDTAHKAAILAALAYGHWFGLEPIHVEGIRGISLDDLRYADELGYRIKLLAIIKEKDGKVQLRVHPTLLPKSALLADIAGVFNGVMVEGDTVGETLFYGRGAGRQATASAVVADLIDVALNLDRNSARRITFRSAPQFDSVAAMSEVASRYYLRLEVEDSPGVLAALAGILAKRSISISSLIQHEGGDKVVPIVILSHQVAEADMQAAVAEMEALDVVSGKVRLFRIEDI